MRKFLIAVGILIFCLPLIASADSEVHITQGGVASVTAAKVMQLAGSSFFARLYWGTAFIRITIKTSADTKFLRGTGEATTLAEIHEGDILDITGQLEYGSDSLIIVAGTIKNSSVQKEQANFSGTVTAVDGNGQFTLNTKTAGVITVATSDTTGFSKGTRTLDFAHITVGDTITKASGDYNLTTKVLSATSIVTYVDMNKYKPQNFQGKLTNVSGNTLKVVIGKTEYAVNLSANAQILTNNKKTTTLGRFVTGDTVRLYGTAREVDDPIIDAEIVRNLSL